MTAKAELAAIDPGQDPIAAVQAWRARHPGPVDPVRLHVVEALARRAAAQEGEARQRLAQRVQDLLALLAETRPEVRGAEPDPALRASPRAALAALSALNVQLGRMPQKPVQALPGSRPGAVVKAALNTGPEPALGRAPAPLKSVAAFKGTWSRLRAEQRLRQALAQVPAKPGPLNSSQLVYRALQEMHALSPAYLDAFLSHVDTLIGLELASGGGDNAARPAERAHHERRPGAKRARKG